MSSSSSKKKRSSRSSQGSLPNTRELLIVRPETDSPLSSVSGSIGSLIVRPETDSPLSSVSSFPSMLGSDSSVESNSSGLQNTAALLRVPPPPRSSYDSISAATYRGLSSSSSSRSRRRGRGRAGPASKKIMFRINPQVGPTVYGVPRIAPPPPPPRTRRVRMVAPKRNSSSSSSSSWSRSRGRAGPASSRIMFRINPRAGPTVYRVPRIAPPPPPPRTRGVRMVAPKRNSSLERRRRAEWREFRGNLRDKFGVTFPSRSSSSSSSVSRRRSPSRSRTPSSSSSVSRRRSPSRSRSRTPSPK